MRGEGSRRVVVYLSIAGIGIPTNLRLIDHVVLRNRTSKF